MGRRLISTVLVTPEPGSGAAYASFGPDDEDIPEWAMEQMGDHCFADDDEQDDQSSESESAPKRRSRKSAASE